MNATLNVREMTNASVLMKFQALKYRVDFELGDKPKVLVAIVRYDDACGNGHNTFSITGEHYEHYPRRGELAVTHKRGKKLWLASCGCLHDDIRVHFPNLAPLLKWHLTSSDGPMHYVDNSLYWAGRQGWCNGGPNDPPNLDHFRGAAVWPEATQQDLQDVTEAELLRRLPALLAEFRQAVESLGFTY